MRILLATDGSPCSDVAVDEVARRPWPAGTMLRVISIMVPPTPLVQEPLTVSEDLYSQLEEVERKSRGDAVERAAERLRARSASTCDLHITAEVLEGSPRRVIVEEAERYKADLIIVGSHGYRSWERMLLGSVSHSVALHADCSVEIVRCRKC